MNYCFFPSWFGSQSHLIWEVVSFSIIAWSLFLVWLFAFFIWCAQNEGLAERNSHCANLLLVGRRQYWAQHLAEPVEEEMYCRLSKLAWAWGFNPQEQGFLFRDLTPAPACRLLALQISQGLWMPFLGSGVSPAHVLLEIDPLPSQNTQAVWPALN